MIALAGDLQRVLARLQTTSVEQAARAGWCANDPAVSFDEGALFDDEVAASDAVGCDDGLASSDVVAVTVGDDGPLDDRGRRATPLPTVEGGSLACTLEPHRMSARMTAWQDLVARASEREPIPGGVALQFPVDADLAGEITTLAAAERDCCTFLRFDLRIGSTALTLEVTGLPEAAPIIAVGFGTPRRAEPSPSDAGRR